MIPGIKHICLVFSIVLGFVLSLQAQYWTAATAADIPRSAEDIEFPFADRYHLAALDAPALLRQLARGGRRPVLIQLPMPDGSLASAYALEDPVIAPELAGKFPEIKTYRIRPADGNGIRGRIGWTYQGFHASLRTREGAVWIDPYLLHQTRYYKVYHVGENLERAELPAFVCEVDGERLSPEDLFSDANGRDGSLQARAGDPVVTRTYRTAVACTGEYAQYQGGTVQQALAAIVVALNRLNEVTETDLAIRLELVGDNESVIFLDPDTDPFNNANPGTLISNVQTVLNQNIGASNYDVGHVVSTGPTAGGGIASLFAVCDFETKGRGVSTRANPINDPFIINILAHEFGHQFGATHTMSSCQNVEPSTSYEPGGGSTIMGYAGICSPENNIVLNSGPYFHTASLEQIFQYMRNGQGDDCATKQDLGNTEPEVSLDYENGFFIPISTPFELTASATDEEDETLTYCWEQFDKEEAIQTPPGNPIGNSPIFRSFTPGDSPTRIFPRLPVIVANQNPIDEVLPTYARDLTFRCTVRDNHPGGGAAVWQQVGFQTTEQAGPFLVTNPTVSTTTWTAGEYREVTWSVANTDQAPVNCRFVTIRLSLDGGFTYPILLAERTPNTGSAFVTVPKTESVQARVKIEAADNIFFDISNQNFTIQAATEPGYSLTVDAPRYIEACTPVSIDIPIGTDSLLGFNNPITLDIANQLPDGVDAQFSETTILPRESSTLTLTIPNSVNSQEFDLELRAVAEDADTAFRQLTLRVISNNFDELALVAPANGETGIVLSTDFAWLDNVNADAYDIEIATSPAFGGTVVESASNLSDTSYTPTILFEENTLYYWRVRPRNECGEGDWLLPFGFHTVNAACNAQQPNDVPINISATGTPTVESSIFVTTSGAVSDINVPNVTGSYSIVRDVRISLVSPAGTVVNLFDQNCGGTAPINLGFDDEAPQPIQCPPDDGIVFQPEEALSNFNGEDTQGEWKLRVQVVNSGGGGSLEDWEVEFCANLIPSNPFVVTNDTFFTPPGIANTILNAQLLVDDDDNSAEELLFTLVKGPDHGELQNFGLPLRVGDSFSQKTIDDGGLFYAHNGDDNDFDQWIFTVKDGTGGWIPNQVFNIAMDADAPVRTEELTFAGPVRIFPNPASSRLNVEWEEPVAGSLEVALYTLQGRQLAFRRFGDGQQRIQLDIAHLPSGMYVLRLASGDQQLSHKVSVVR